MLTSLSNKPLGVQFKIKMTTRRIAYVRYTKASLKYVNLTVYSLYIEFSAVCQESTDFHFPDLEQQFGMIEQEVFKANDWRQQQKIASEEGGDQISVKSSGSSCSEVCIILQGIYISSTCT